MKALELDQKDIEESVSRLQELDYKTVSIKEIEELLRPFFKGYRVKAPSFDSGFYIYRSRICNDKPNHLGELSYPPKKFITEYGRANDIGQPMFYGSISKNIPFFELNAKVGDRLAMSVWKTKSKLLLNHIGFSEEVFTMLASNRDINSIYQFASDTRNFNDLNTFVYNYLAAAFAKKISRAESDFYKLSIALTNKLIMGDLLHGVLYPSIAMKGNSDNIVLKPSFVDDNIEFVAVEYLEVTASEDMQFKYEVLDSATEIHDEKLKWTGKVLGWALESQTSITFNSDGSDWIAKNETGQRSDPKPTTIIRNNLSKLERKYLESFPNAAKIAQDIFINNAVEKLTAKCTLLLDFDNRTRFLSFYIPNCINPLDVADGLIQRSNHFLTMDKEQEIEMRNQTSELVLSLNKHLFFDNNIYIFSESYIDSKSLEKYKMLNINIQNE